MKEAEFQKQVVHAARLNGWIVAHFRASLNQRGKWQTAVGGDAKGFPDLVLVRDRIIFAELKTDVGRLRPEQKEWQRRLVNAGGLHFVWRPRDWDSIMLELKRLT